MIKILMTTARMPVNGISNVIIQYYRGLDKNKFKIDLLTSSIDNIYKKEIEKLNGRVILWPERENNPIKYFHKLSKLLKEEQYDIIHHHGNSATMTVEMLAAKWSGIPVRIPHSHNTTCIHKYYDKVLRPIFYRTYTDAIACGVDAGKWMYGNREFTVMNNGVDLEKFKFNKDKRAKIREKLEVEDKLVIGHVGRFIYQKNHEFLLKSFASLLQKRDNVVLLLVGTGPKSDEIKKRIVELDIQQYVILYGVTDEPEAMYSVFDVFAFPSRFEGLPFVLIETQASGLPAIVSSNVTSEVCCTDFTIFEDIHDPETWGDSILKVSQNIEDRNIKSEKAREKLEELGYSIQVVSKSLEKFYINALNNSKKG